MTSPMRQNTITSLGSEGAPPSYHEYPPEVSHGGVGSTHHIDDQTNAELSRGLRPHSIVAKSVGKLLPLSCFQCSREFKGKYQRGNRMRHMRNMHDPIAHDDVSRECRYCDKTFKRADAKKKHEWEKHGAPDCRPEKRGVEKPQKGKKVSVRVEKRIYMPNEDLFQSVTD